MNEIKRRIKTGETGMMLIVPEQYSHDAERHLCTVCGDRLSLHAEVLSFTRLCSNVLSETGNAARPQLTESGQILAMFRALEAVAPGLRVFGIKRMRTEVITMLLETVKEFKTLNITPHVLERAAEQTSNPLSDKLRDLALIYDSYDALLHIHGGDATERLSLLADCISESSVGSKGHIFFDGFTDFTALELNVIEELLKKGANITICLTCDMNDTGEIFKIPQRTVAQLTRLDKTGGSILSGETRHPSPRRIGLMSHPPSPRSIGPLSQPLSYAPELSFLEKHLFEDSPPKFPRSDDDAHNDSDVIKLYRAPTRYVECEYAAYEVLKLVRSGYRWRDIGVMARDWEEYGSICENVFEKYGIPYFTGGKADILNKPPMALIDAALEIATFGWEYKSIFKYLKTGLIDVTADQCALLENYVLKWQIRGSIWNKKWTMPVSGYSNAKPEDDIQLVQINKLRLKIVKPLQLLRDGIKGESPAEAKLKTLYDFLRDIKLPQQLAKKTDDFAKRGEMRLSDEYSQLWDITVDAIEQMYTIIGDDKLTAAEFHKLLILALSPNNVGVIPVSLDRTQLGGMAMSRRRDLKSLIILGATDDNLPAMSKNSGALSDNERIMLRKLGTDIIAGLDERLYREMNMLYSTLTLPSEKLVLIYSTGENQRPSFINKRLSEMFSVPDKVLNKEEYMAIAKTPYTELMYCMRERDLQLLHNFNSRRDGLTKRSSDRLYGEKFSMSATRVDSFYSCPYKYFLKNGLKLEPRNRAEFDAMTAGNFMHFVLDNVFRELKSSTGFRNIDEKIYSDLIKKYTDEFIKDVLVNFEGKSVRFEYLFKRYKSDVEYVVRDMIEELGNSSFEPLDFELDMRELSETEQGFIDRVDGYEYKNKLFLRVLDYKTRKKAYSFELSDILNGRDMQMLIYLFALQRYGNTRYGKEVDPAGVLYIPARDVILTISRDATDEEIQKKRVGEMRRSGLILNDPDVIESMEHGGSKDYLPVKSTKEGGFTGDSLVSTKQLDLLSKHVQFMLENAKKSISDGLINCTPYYKSEGDNACVYCDYSSICAFDEELGDKFNFVDKMKSEEVWKVLETYEG